MTTLIEILLNTTPNGECLEWAGYINYRGYGASFDQGKEVLMHRLSYTLAKGEIPEGLVVMHSCDNRRCVNPKHLSVGTLADNTRDMLAKGRQNQQVKTHCPQGHPYTPEKTYLTNGGKGRSCVICRKAHNKKTVERRKAERKAKNN